MKLSINQIQHLAAKVLSHWKAQKVVHFKTDENKVLHELIEVLKLEEQKIVQLEKEVIKMLDQLEKTHDGEFERYKMYPLLLKKMAKDKKVVL